MKWNDHGGKMMKFAGTILGGVMVLNGASVWAQAAPAAKPAGDAERTFYLHNVSDSAGVNDVVTALRNVIDPGDKIYLLPSQNAIIMRASPEELTLAEGLLKELDRLKKTYRLTYTLEEMDQGKLVGRQHFAVIVVSGGRTTFKNGSKIPILTGTTSSGSTTSKTEFTYLDIGLNIDASLDDSLNGVRLQTKVERSSVAEERGLSSVEDPIIRQTVLQGTSILTPGKEALLGSLDVPGSSRHLEIRVVAELVP